MTNKINSRGENRSMDGPGPKDIGRILAVTDAIGLHREAVRIPLDCVDGGAIERQGAVLQITAACADFETWLAALGERLRGEDLSGLPRAD